MAGLGAGADRALTVLWAAYRWTGDRKYMQPFLDAGPRGLGQLAANGLDWMGVRDTWGPQFPSLLAGPGESPAAARHFAWQATGDTEVPPRPLHGPGPGRPPSRVHQHGRQPLD